jgi:hypothetical protein
MRTLQPSHGRAKPSLPERKLFFFFHTGDSAETWASVMLPSSVPEERLSAFGARPLEMPGGFRQVDAGVLARTLTAYPQQRFRG